MAQLPTDFDYILYYDAAGRGKYLPVAAGTDCSARPAPGDLNPAQIATMVDSLPTPLPAKHWEAAGCALAADGPWGEDNDNPPSFLADAPTGGDGSLPTGTVADDLGVTELGGIVQSDQNVN